MEQDHIADRLALGEAMAQQLVNYLTGSELYRPLRVAGIAGSEQRNMTIGALLENLEALHCQDSLLTADQRAQLATIWAEVDRARHAWPEPWLAMLHRELKAVLDSWKWYLDDAEGGERARDNYRSEVHNRTRLELLVKTLAGDPESAAEVRRLGELDARLREMWQPGGYVGVRELQACYPAAGYWWLYGRPKPL
jgi:hypothetical protein